MPCSTDKRPPSRSLWRVCLCTKHADIQFWELISLVFSVQFVNKAANNSFIHSQHSSIYSVEHMVEETNSNTLTLSPRVLHIISLDPNSSSLPDHAGGHKSSAGLQATSHSHTADTYQRPDSRPGLSSSKCQTPS